MKKKKHKSKKIKIHNPVAIEKDIKSILARVARVQRSDIKGDVNIRDRLGIDSLSAMEILAAIETKFGITIDEAKAFDVVIVKDLHGLIKEYLSK